MLPDGRLLELVTDGSQSGPILKRWRSPDGTCPIDNHRTLDGLTSPAREPFVIDGEKLRFPGDTSLGATKETACACRCYLDWFLQLPDGSEAMLVHGRQRPARTPGTLNPTSIVTLNGRSKGKIVLGDLSIANFRQMGEVLEVYREGKTLGRICMNKDHGTDLYVHPALPKEADLAGFLLRTAAFNSKQ